MSFADFQKQVDAARDNSEERRSEFKTARQQAENQSRRRNQLLREISAETRANDERWVEINRLQAESVRTSGLRRSEYAAALEREWGRLHEFLQFTNPMENISALEDFYPILLFPMRLEVRFKKVQRENALVDQLWVRVFPDDIAINTFESDLSETEIRNIRSYWLARWKSAQDVDGHRGAWRSLASAHGSGRAYWLTNTYVPLNRDEQSDKAGNEIILAIGTDQPLVDPERNGIMIYWREVWKANKDGVRLGNAWNHLLEAVGEERALQLVKDYRPSNLNDLPPTDVTRDETTVRVEFVIFPVSEELDAKLHSWSQPPTSTILPERFVFLAYNGREPALPPQLGNLVPPQLILGPDPAADEGEDFRLASAEDVDANPNIQEGDLIVSEGMRWMFDFDEAVARGMGFRIDLSPEQAANGFDRVFVLGVKLSADRTSGQRKLEELFAQHQTSRKGFSILKQGTPTNNTEEQNAGYSWRQDPDQSFNIYFDNSTPRSDPSDWFAKTDGRWLAEMLGIVPEKLHTVENYYSTDISEAKAMQRALWPATMGHFMDSMMNPVFSTESIEWTRQFFTRFVSGRGNLPAIRVGKQPYGILPATNYTNMELFKPDRRRAQFFTAAITPGFYEFLPALYAILMDIDQTWTSLVQRVAHVGKAGDAHQILLDIIGLHPDSVEMYKRYANSLKQVHNVYNVKGMPHTELSRFYVNSYGNAANLLAKYGYIIDTEHPEPDILKKTFFRNAMLLKGDRIDKVPNSEVNQIGIYTPVGADGSAKNYIGWLIEAADISHDRLRMQDGFIDDQPPTALLYLLLHHALDLSYVDTSLKLYLSAGVISAAAMRQAYIEPDFIHVEEQRDTESRWTHLYRRDARITDTDITIGEYITQNLNTLDEAAAFRDVLSALRQLEHVPTAALERALMEHIDTISYRYDSWVLGFVNLELEAMRGVFQPEGSPTQGIYLGAYGWLENVRSENKELTPPPLPADLKDVFDRRGDLVEDSKNAGYILTPSQNHAVTAAVLRNGHLSHEDPEDKEKLKIKLSSERVRKALQIIEGIQAGQSLSALLGYQFERGLHDHTEAEVDGFIFDLRQHFPLVAKKFKDTAPGAEDTEYESIDQIEAKNVIDGVAFLEYIEKQGNESYPFDLSNMPTADDTQAAAINAELQDLKELNDAVADVALAESVHQVVLGNYERAAATLETYSKGNFPPMPDVIRTPRSGTQLTHRVALQFKSGLSHTLTDAGVTPRMLAEPAIHDWLKGIMPGMDEIVCVVHYFDRVLGTEEEEQVSLADIHLTHIDALYLLNIESEQAMSALDDRMIQFVLSAPAMSPRMDQRIHIEYTRKLEDDKFTVFEMTSLIGSLRAMILKAKPLTAADVRLANETSKENEKTIRLDANRVKPLVDELNVIRTDALATFITGLSAIIDTEDVGNIVDELDTWMASAAGIFTQTSAFGMTQAGTGFIYQWHQSMFARLRTKVEDLIERLEEHRGEYITLRNEFTAAPAGTPLEDLLAILRKAELKVSTSLSVLQPSDTLTDYLTLIETTKLPSFENLLDVTLPPILDIGSLTDLIEAVQVLMVQLPEFDSVGIEINDEMKQVDIFADDLLTHALNLSSEIETRTTKANQLLAGLGDDSAANVQLISSAAHVILGEDFMIVPEFTIDTKQGTEWQNALVVSSNSLRYLLNDLDMDFPVDDWLYGISRVREKLYHLENTILHIEGFNSSTLVLRPTQFPYREDDFWLGMQFPLKKPGTEEPFKIDEDKLLYTSIYTETFDPGRTQCGLLLDEWTEVIPARQETIGMTFHYDQPNSEPPQTLLLVTPSNIRKAWQWEDLVNTLHETLDMAKKRAVEPAHVDKTVYSRFLPPIVSLASPQPLTPALNLAINNLVFFTRGNQT